MRSHHRTVAMLLSLFGALSCLSARAAAYSFQTVENGSDLNSTVCNAAEVPESLAAGDTVISAFTLFHAAGATDREAAVISNQAAGIVVGKAGTATTDPAEIAASFKIGAETDHA